MWVGFPSSVCFVAANGFEGCMKEEFASSLSLYIYN